MLAAPSQFKISPMTKHATLWCCLLNPADFGSMQSTALPNEWRDVVVYFQGTDSR